jgi:hypothetical protein
MEKQLTEFKSNRSILKKKKLPKRTALSRSPRLDTILMVEKTLFRYKSDKTITEIWRSLPRKVMWTTFTTILNYLEYSGKIHLEADKTITWLWDPHKIEELKRKGLVII